ncbi:hypothetical protein BH10BAC5_BH10BAC5_27910 [soil metagenome]
MKTLKLYFSVMVVCVAVLSIKVQAQVSEQWTSYYTPGTGTNQDIKATVIDAANNVYVTGESSNAQFDYDIVTVKYNSAGVQQWLTRYHRTPNPISSAVPTAIAIDNSGNVFVCGVTTVVSGNGDMVTIKYNSLGVEQWANIVAGDANSQDYANDIKTDNTGNVFVTGHYITNFSLPVVQIATIKYNSAGVQQWLKTFRMNSTNGTNGGVGLAMDNSGNACVTGWSSNSFDQIYIVTIKYNTAGDSLWTRLFQNSNPSGSFHQIYSTKITSDAAGNFYVGGYSASMTTQFEFVTLKYNSTGSLVWSAFNPGNGSASQVRDIKSDNSGNVFFTGITHNVGTRSSFATVKYNSSGILMWSKIYNGNASTSNDEPFAIALDNKGNSYVTGDNNSGSANSMLTTVKYDSLGNKKWEISDLTNSYGTSGSRSISVDTTGNVYVGGFANNLTKYLTIKYSQTVGIINIFNTVPDGFKLSQNYPNPFNPKTNINFSIPANGFVKMTIFNSLGQEVSTLINKEMTSGEYRTDWNAAEFPSGEYFYRLEISGQKIFIAVKKMILVK